MKKEITGNEYSKLPVYAHCCYEFVSHDIYRLKKITHENFISMMYYHSNIMSYAQFKIWYFANSPVMIVDNLQII